MKTRKKVFSEPLRLLFLILFSFLLFFSEALQARAAEQRAFALKNPVTLYTRPSERSTSWEAGLPDGGVVVPSAVRDKNNALWYKVTVNGRTGWLFNEGVRLRMGNKSKYASTVYKRCAGVRADVMKNAGSSWSRDDGIEAGPESDGEVVTYRTTKGGLFQVLITGPKVEDIYFCATGPGACKTFLGFDPVGMGMSELRKKAGTPTARETPDGEREVVIVSYELADRDMTMAFHLRDDRVEKFELYRGLTGGASQGWSPDVLYKRDSF